MGLLDAFMGNGTVTPSAGSPSFSDRLSNPLTQVGLQLLANNGRPATEGAFNGVPEALKRSAQAQEKNKTLEFLKVKHPDIYGYVQAGLDPGQAFQLAMRREDEQKEDKRYEANRAFQMSQADRAQSNADRSFNLQASQANAPTSQMRNFQFAKDNPDFAQYLGGAGSELPTSIREITERERLAPTYNLDPKTPEGRSFVLTGRLPSAERTSTADDRKAIRETDDAVLAGQATVNLLDRANELSKTAYDGAGAGSRAWLASQFGDKAALDTVELDNIVKEQALGQLKAIFGGAPTEGERAILLEIQGASSQPQAVRERIFARTKSAVEKRLQYNKDRANELRGGTYYDARPDGSTPGIPAGSGIKSKYGLD